MAEHDSQKKPGAPKLPDRIRFHYIKGNFFRVVHVDGVFGGPTPRGLIQMNFYSERGPIPQTATYAVTPEGRLGGEIPSERTGRDGPVREIEVGAVMDLTTAKALRVWLNGKIKALESAKLLEREEQKGSNNG